VYWPCGDGRRPCVCCTYRQFARQQTLFRLIQCSAMKLLRLYIFFIFIVSALFAGAQIQPGAKPQTVVIRAGTLLDGTGHELHNMFMNAKKAPLTAFPARCLVCAFYT